MSRDVHVDVWCDGCGIHGTAHKTKPAPRGWFFVMLRYNGMKPAAPDPNDTNDVVVACSEKCRKKISWGRVS